MPWPVPHGPDIAHYQLITGEPVDPTWRLFSHKCSEGSNSGDVTFPVRWQWMRAEGFRYRGAYHWLRSDSSIAGQAANIIRRLDAQGGLREGEFIQSDWETTPNIPINQASDEREFCDRVEQHYGRACTITYTSDWIPDSPDDSDTVGEFFNWLDLTQGNAPLWYANYNTDPTNVRGGQQECARYGADVWQFTSSFRHPSIVSKSGGGFDMNHVIRWETLDRIAGYTDQTEDEQPPLPIVEEDMKAIIYTVTTTTVGGAWFYVSPERTCAQIRNVNEKDHWVSAGAIERTADSVEAFVEMLKTFQPLGALSTQGQLVLGAASTDWAARAAPASGAPGVAAGYTGTISLTPKVV